LSPHFNTQQQFSSVELSVDCIVDPHDFENRWKETPVFCIKEYQMSHFPSEEKLTEFLGWRHFWVIAFGEKLPIIRSFAYAQATNDDR
jgi:hypothetical protein